MKLVPANQNAYGNKNAKSSAGSRKPKAPVVTQNGVGSSKKNERL